MRSERINPFPTFDFGMPAPKWYDVIAGRLSCLLRSATYEITALRDSEGRLLRLLIVIGGLGKDEAGILAEGEIDAPGGGEDQQAVAAVIFEKLGVTGKV